MIPEPHNCYPAVHSLLIERNSHSVAPSVTVIPAKAGIHRGRIPPSPTRRDLRIMYCWYCAATT